MATRKKVWSKTVEAHGVTVRLFDRGGSIYRDVALDRTTSANGNARTKHDVRSLKHSDRELARSKRKRFVKNSLEPAWTAFGQRL